MREEQPWSRNVSFEDFCEYVLPLLDDIRHLPEAQDPLFVSKVLIDSVASRIGESYTYDIHGWETGRSASYAGSNAFSQTLSYASSSASGVREATTARLQR